MENAQLKTLKMLLYFHQILASSRMLSDTESNNVECKNRAPILLKLNQLCYVVFSLMEPYLCGSISLCVKEHHQLGKTKIRQQKRRCVEMITYFKKFLIGYIFSARFYNMLLNTTDIKRCPKMFVETTESVDRSE